MILGGVDGDPIQPGIEGAVATKPRQGAKRLDERLLGDVRHILRITQVAAHQVEDLELISTEQKIKCSTIALLDASTLCDDYPWSCERVATLMPMIEAGWFAEARMVGLTAGASTPDYVIDEVEAAVEQQAYADSGT